MGRYEFGKGLQMKPETDRWRPPPWRYVLTAVVIVLLLSAAVALLFVLADVLGNALSGGLILMP